MGMWAVTGNPGEGKSAFLVRFVIVPTLLHSHRVVSTNIHINRDKLKAYIEKMGGEYDDSQLIVWPHVDPGETKELIYRDYREYASIHPDEIEAFKSTHGDKSVYKFKEPDDDSPWFTAFESFENTKDYNPSRFWECAPDESLVVLDEAANYLNAYTFSNNEASKILGEYTKLHRHQGHDVYFGLQHFEHMAKQSRDLVDYEYRLYNLHKNPLLGIKLPFFWIRKYDHTFKKGHAVIRGRQLRMFDYEIFGLYNSEQHKGSVDVLAKQTFTDTKKVKRSFKRRIIDSIANAPLFTLLSVFIVLVLIYFFTSYSSYFKSSDEKKSSETIPKEKNENKNNNNDAPDSSSDTGLFSATPRRFLPAPARTESPSPRIINEYRTPKVRGYKLNTSSASGSSE